ncbi:MAG: hypothetical protein ABR84_07035 [Cryomorphaceae bacterium BACL21 MAG-121220-bin10]|nr:MAG: hypothetical protein ABR84_07035 [Cryomorphaceae bacterium BACL21 MAG-121220-bin10]
MNHKKQPLMLHYGVVFVLCLIYGYFAYFLERAQTTYLLLGFCSLWGLSAYIIARSPRNWRWDLSIGLLFRLTMLAALPNLSQDFYRFIWDGYLTAHGLNPYLYAPVEILRDPSLIDLVVPNGNALVTGMGSLNAGHFTNYPPIMQWLFAVPHWLGIKALLSQVISLRILLIAADIVVFFAGRGLLKQLDLPQHRINWYFLNPFIIIELSGNLHFEGVMLGALTLGLLALSYQRYSWAGWSIGASVLIKLIPLMFLPLLLRHIAHPLKSFRSYAKGISLFMASITLVFLIAVLPYASGYGWQHYTQTTALWFTNFEFNASVYYLIRWVGYQWVGYNLIGLVGPALSLMVFAGILTLAWANDLSKISGLIKVMLWSIALYLLLATTVHPWYWATPLLLSLFTSYRFAILGSLLIMLSYTGYHESGVQEHAVWLTLEYLGIFGLAFYEILKKSKPRTPHLAP